MRSSWLALCLSCAVCSGCATTTDPTSEFTAIESTYAGYLTAELTYLNSGKTSPTIIASLEQVRLSTHAVLAPIEAEMAAGTAPSSTEVETAQLAINAFSQILTTNGVTQ